MDQAHQETGRFISEGQKPEVQIYKSQEGHRQGLAGRLPTPLLCILPLCPAQRCRFDFKEPRPPQHHAVQERLQRCGHKGAGKGILGYPADPLPIAAVKGKPWPTLAAFRLFIYFRGKLISNIDSCICNYITKDIFDI